MHHYDRIDPGEYPTAGLLRRVAALLYDSLLILALLVVAMLLVVLPLGMFHGWEQFDSAGLRRNPFYIVYLACVPLVFYLGFWSRGGQTLGMRSWRMLLIREDGTRPGLGDALLRFLAALLSLLPFGLGFLWILVDPENLAWHDRLSHTRPIVRR